MSRDKPLVLVIVDGFGYLDDTNPIAPENLPFLSTLWRSKRAYSFLLDASGSAVGLPDGVMGNSEVGHLTIGSGTVVPGVLPQINQAIKDRSFHDHKVLRIIDGLDSNKHLHVITMLSRGGVHSHDAHLYALVSTIKPTQKIVLHIITDGRDSPVQSARQYLKDLQQHAGSNVVIGSIQGRFHGMDRDNNLERTAAGFNVMTNQSTEQMTSQASFDRALELLDQWYAADGSDQMMPPTNISSGITSGDGVVMTNFRPDRARQLITMIIDQIDTAFFVTLGLIDTSFKERGVRHLYGPQAVEQTLLSVLEDHQVPVYLSAETEKYAHVTYFFDGMIDRKRKLQIRNLVPSEKCASYATDPSMSIEAITKNALAWLDNNTGVLILNFANIDMVGHTGDAKAVVEAAQIVDRNLHALYQAITQRGGRMVITADHGNGEVMSENGQPHAAHTNNQVPCIITKPKDDHYETATLGKDVGLSGVAPTILKLLNIDIPTTMHRSLLKKRD